jgi:lipopolysaccharide biosynthesis glycosyltransferase
VLLTSLFHNNRKNQLVIHSIATGISESEKKGIEDYVKQNGAEILFYDIDEDYVRNHVVIPPNVHFTIATYYRLFLPALVSGVTDRLFYIDTDAVVREDLKNIYHTNIGNLPFAAVPDSFPELRTDLGIFEKGNYFNAGVLLIDIANWQAHRVTEKAMQFLADHPEKIRFVDQDALNGTQQGQWYQLPQKYNITWFDVLQEVPKKKLLQNAAIIHYTGGNKPWNALGANKLRHIYHYYRKRSPFASQKKYTDFRWSAGSIRQFLFIRLLEWYFEHPLIVTITRKIRGRASARQPV